ncbi:hypothetical protein OG453_29945 [Streptomyces sp. NBC_01381]|uniref:hypothetical protein n=1 Tax=Streptomyces sp. NBC_01381 TaxID=2903845 RepID=UPI002251CFA0|nr:hypothetical protein [Streptomyces sp. NBC_01381]MCX4670869.1 hypothetical protein [Streptomyces sp. NBC_01381]
MTLNPATAAIIGMSLGAVASFSGAWLTQHATNKRERENRVWTRCMEVYEEAMIVVHQIGDLRTELSATGELPVDARAAMAGTHALAARLEIYATKPVLDAHWKHFKAMHAWKSALEAWDAQEGTNPRASRADPLWRKFTDRVKESEEADRQFLSTLRTEVHGERERRNAPWKWRPFR